MVLAQHLAQGKSEVQTNSDARCSLTPQIQAMTPVEPLD